MDALKSFTYSSGGSSSSAAYQANWVDITEEFRDASKGEQTENIELKHHDGNIIRFPPPKQN